MLKSLLVAKRFFTPVRTTFVASLFLSLVARLGGTINRDGMLYVKVAHVFLEDGFTAAQAVFNWPFLSIVMAITAKLSGLSAEHAGYLLNALFMAGACALMVACVECRQTEATWMASLVVLALPGLNEYRNELLREYGCWFFVMLAFWLAIRWSERPRWLSAFSVQLALGTAALFRPEALALFPALIAWQWFDAPQAERSRRLLMLGALPLAGGAILVSLYLSGNLGQGSRMAGEFGRISTARFDAKAQSLAVTLIDYARVHARTILFFGSLALIPLKLLPKFGLFLLPLITFLSDKELRVKATRHASFAWGIAAHVLVLVIFVLDLQFLAGRYVSLILLFSTPFVAAGLLEMTRRFPRWRSVMIGIAVTLMVSNVVSTSPGKTYLVDAGHWLAENIADQSKVYIDSGRAAYHAGWQTIQVASHNNREGLTDAVKAGRYEVFVLEISRKDSPVDTWLEQLGLCERRRFSNSNGDAITIAMHCKSQTNIDHKLK